MDTASDADVAALRDALIAYNIATTGYDDARSLSCFLHVEDRLVAGIDGFTWGGYAHIEHLWVDESLRGHGLGHRLLEAAEVEARARGCATIALDSHEFQAPDFYRARGYTEIGATRETPAGFGQFYFQKFLGPPTA